MAMMPHPQPHPIRGDRSEVSAGQRRPHLGPDSASGLSDLDEVLDEFTLRWERGESPKVEEYAHRLPPDKPDGLVELIFHEFCLAESSGHRPDPNDYYRRFPNHRERLNRLIDLHQALPASQFGPLSTPGDGPPVGLEPGDEIGPYRLVRELGRGGFARVFLAEQSDLEDRHVVIKVTTRPTPEPKLLARTPHAHIVSVLREATTDEGLQILCMPFLGGATLSAILIDQRDQARRPSAGSELLAALDRVSAPEFPEAKLDRSAREILASLSYPKAIAWIVARLAEALQHALDKGVTHGDLKPSNILLAADGQPMLLDFNLSTDWRESIEGITGAGSGSASSYRDAGGTLAYMAPERLDGIANPELARPSDRLDRHRADLFALGLVLREALTGQPPWVPEERPRSTRKLAEQLARVRRGQDPNEPRKPPNVIPPGLRPILNRCLAPAPSDRYRSASELAEDLDRWRADLAPRHTKTPWWAEATRQARRRRRALVAGGLCLAVGVISSIGVAVPHRGTIRTQAQLRLEGCWEQLHEKVYPLGQHGSWLREPGIDPASNALNLLSYYEAFGPKDWRNREDVRPLSLQDQQELELWLLEQAWRHGRAVLAPEYQHFPEIREQALAGLERMTDLAETTPIKRLIWKLRESLMMPESDSGLVLGELHWSESYLLGLEAELLNPTEAVTLGLDPMSIGSSKARHHYRDFLSIHPDSYWTHYRISSVALRQGLTEVADQHLTFCLTRRPDSPAIHMLRTTCLDAMGRHDEAREACEKALVLAPNSEEALKIRVIIEARAPDPLPTELIIARFRLMTKARGHLPVLLLNWEAKPPSMGRAEQVKDIAQQILATNPENLDVRFNLAAHHHMLDQRQEALEEYSKILEQCPSYLPARFNRAILLQREHRLEEAILDYTQIIDDARLDDLMWRTRNQAIVAFHVVAADRFRRGRLDDALHLASRGLDQAERAGDMRGESHYSLARAYAMSARHDPTLLRKSEHHLRAAKAINPRFIVERLKNDPAFDGLVGALPVELTSDDGR
ncbi:hypothetical protein BH23PLA1_BH23PLA1_33580 [soil metagenome]